MLSVEAFVKHLASGLVSSIVTDIEKDMLSRQPHVFSKDGPYSTYDWMGLAKDSSIQLYTYVFRSFYMVFKTNTPKKRAIFIHEKLYQNMLQVSDYFLGSPL